MSMDREAKDIDWSTARLPEGATGARYGCQECGARIITRHRLGTMVAPSYYCAQCEHGPPLWTYAVDFPDETVVKSGWEEFAQEDYDAEE